MAGSPALLGLRQAGAADGHAGSGRVIGAWINSDPLAESDGGRAHVGRVGPVLRVGSQTDGSTSAFAWSVISLGVRWPAMVRRVGCLYLWADVAVCAHRE